MKLAFGSKECVGRPFHILGFDLMLDSMHKAWILEVNGHPSLNIYFEKEFLNISKKSDADVCPIDLYVKGRVVKDAIKLATKKDFFEKTSFRGLKLIYSPVEGDEM